LKIKYPAPAKIIVYSQEIEEAERLSEALGAMLYHAKVDDRSGKDKRLTEWKSGAEESRVAVASKALGLGIDTGDTRAVVHAGMPWDLADYVQESGRAGRDGLCSEAIVLLPAQAAKRRPGVNSRELGPRQAVIYQHKKERGDQEEEEMGREVEEYVPGRCRRVVINRVMDGNFQRRGCIAGEEACDLCQHTQARELMGDEGCKGSTEDGTDGRAEGSAVVTALKRQDRQRDWINVHVQQKEKQEAYEVEELEQALERFSKRCVYCYVCQYPSTSHSIEQCTAAGAEGVRGGVQEFIRVVQEKRSMERFSCCLYCYIPQAICEHWKHKEEDGRWEEDCRQEC
jgi:superfamily II DNA helicase RecQ